MAMLDQPCIKAAQLLLQPLHGITLLRLYPGQPSHLGTPGLILQQGGHGLASGVDIVQRQQQAAAPGTSVPAAGTPQAMASMVEIPKPSFLLSSKCRSKAGISKSMRCWKPVNKT